MQGRHATCLEKMLRHKMMIPIPTIQPFKTQRLLVKLKLIVGKDAMEVLGYFRIKNQHLFLVSKVHS